MGLKMRIGRGKSAVLETNQNVSRCVRAPQGEYLTVFVVVINGVWVGCEVTISSLEGS